MTVWALLSDAYGSAREIPGLLAQAKADGRNDGWVWDELWGRLCHQGTVYSASYPAIPALAEMADGRAPDGYSAPLHLAAAIIASHDGPETPTVVRERYPVELVRLRELAERNLPYSNGDGEFIYGLQALMAFEDGGVWQRNLEAIADGEITLECPDCHDFLVMGLDQPEFKMASFADASVGSMPVVPVDPLDDSPAQRIVALSRRHGFDGVAALVPYLLSHVVCPSCREGFDLPDALV